MTPGRTRKLYESDNFIVSTALMTLPKKVIAKNRRKPQPSNEPTAGPSKCANKQELSVYYQNINGLKSKALEVTMRVDKYDYDILCFTETKYTSDKKFVRIKDYEVASFYCRENAIGGGTMIMLKPGLKYRELGNVVKCSVERHCEVACVDIGNVVILSVYRPPPKDGCGSYAVFEDTMAKILNKISKPGKCLMVCGDFNEDILRSNKKNHKLLDFFDEFSLPNVYFEPTRETNSSSKCIDNIFTDCKILEQYVHHEDISDHKGLDVVVEIPLVQKPQEKLVPLFKSCCILAKYCSKDEEIFMFHDYAGHSELTMSKYRKDEKPFRWEPEDTDLNIIQQIWNNLRKRVLDYYDPAPETLAELREVLDEEMKRFSEKKLQELHEVVDFDSADIHIKFMFRIEGEEHPAEYRMTVFYDPVQY